MTVWKVAFNGPKVSFGDVERRKVTSTGCNEPFKGRYWCPRRKWFLKESCPFSNKRECDNYIHMCGAI